MAGEVFDILVVGGGVTGTGAALDAASRGLSVALIEARDYAAGASSKSSKLIHGGLRYLEMLDFGLVREALRERRLLLTELAPHLVRPVPFLWPLTHRGWERPYVGAGLLLYDSLGGRRAVPRARHLSRAQALRLAPALRADALIGAVPVLRRAGRRRPDGGLPGPDRRRARARRSPPTSGWTGLRTRGRRGSPASPRATCSTGRGPDHPRPARRARDRRLDQPGRRAGDGAGPGGELQVRPSKGVHIVVPRTSIRMDTGLLTRTEKSVLFVIPWGDHWLIGDTDTEWRHDPGRPVASRADIDYLLAKVNQMLRAPARRRRHRGRLRRPAAAGGGAAAPRTPPGSAASTRSARSGPGSPRSPAASTRPTG